MADKTTRSTADINASTNSQKIAEPIVSVERETIATRPAILNNNIPATNPYASCSCTKILITQLFHEMKQEFPTVPDDIVWRYAMNNCHNRAACIEELRIQAEAFPGSVNVYPAALRHQTNKKHISALRRLPSANSNINHTMGTGHSHGGGESLQRLPATPPSPPTISAIKTNEISKSDSNLNETHSGSPQNVQRPNTLNFNSVDIRGRPTRAAPPPPAAVSSSSSAIAGQETFFGDAHADPPLNLSLSVIVSPGTGRPPMRPSRLAPSPQLSTGADNHHHHHHIHRSVQAISPGSSVRSVSVTLHQPNSVAVANSGHPMANETANASGNMDYFDGSGGNAQVGLEITVGPNGASNVNRPSHIRPNNCYAMSEIASDTAERYAVPSACTFNSDTRSGIPMSTNVMHSSEFSKQIFQFYRRYFFLFGRNCMTYKQLTY